MAIQSLDVDDFNHLMQQLSHRTLQSFQDALWLRECKDIYVIQNMHWGYPPITDERTQKYWRSKFLQMPRHKADERLGYLAYKLPGTDWRLMGPGPEVTFKWQCVHPASTNVGTYRNRVHKELWHICWDEISLDLDSDNAPNVALRIPKYGAYVTYRGGCSMSVLHPGESVADRRDGD